MSNNRDLTFVSDFEAFAVSTALRFEDLKVIAVDGSNAKLSKSVRRPTL